MNRAIKIPIVFVPGLGLTMALLWLLGNVTPSPIARAADRLHPAAAPGDVYCVTQDGGSYLGCTKVFTNVQAAVDAASGSETIKVATGVYTDIGAREGVTQVAYISKTVTIQGGYTTTNWTTPYPITQPTTLDAQGQGRVLYITGNISPTIVGLRIVGGNATGLGNVSPEGNVGGGICIISATAMISNNEIFSNTATDLDGGGIYLKHSIATLAANSITSNVAQRGGGLYLDYSSATLNANTIASNSGPYGGGGVYADHGIITFNNNTVLSNTSPLWGGGGLMLEDSPAILNSNIIQGNISGLGPEGGGVSIRNFDSGDITLSGNTFSGNISQYACGGISAAANRITMTGNAILSNTAQHFGGGVCTYGSATLSDNIISGNVVTGSNSSAEGGGAAIEAYPREALVKLVNNVITDNRVNSPDGRGSGMVIAASSNGYLLHTTIARNTGGDGSGICIAYNSTTALTNTILVSQTVGITATAGNTVTVNGVLWYGNGANTAGAGAIAVTHSITDDPAFAPDGYHLTAGSAAIDAGVDAGVTTDIDGEHRPQGSAPDLGADEISLRYVYLPLVLRQSP